MPPADPDTIDRKWVGTRVGFVGVGVVCYFGTLWGLATFPDLSQPEAWAALEWLLGMLGAAICGDTVRPSGMRQAAFGVTTAPPAGVTGQA